MLAKLQVLLQALAPQHAISRVTGWVAGCRWRWCKNLLIRAFVRLYPVDMSEAEDPDPQSYASFNAFFTRQLAPGSRPFPRIAEALISPVDGTLSQLGRINNGILTQAKGHNYSAADLLAGSAEAFFGGHFATIYLAPHNYHRVHMPTNAQLTSMTFIPGRLYSVGSATTAALPGLFARNERVVFHFDSPVYGSFALVMVGAMNVGSVSTVHAGPVMPRSGGIQSWTYESAITMPRGAELARFNLGSTVILLFASSALRWDNSLGPQTEVRLGQAIALPGS